MQTHYAWSTHTTMFSAPTGLINQYKTRRMISHDTILGTHRPGQSGFS